MRLRLFAPFLFSKTSKMNNKAYVLLELRFPESIFNKYNLLLGQCVFIDVIVSNDYT